MPRIWENARGESVGKVKLSNFRFAIWKALGEEMKVYEMELQL